MAIGSETTKTNAVLWLNGNGSQGFLLPAVNNAQTDISGPDAGIVAYQTSDNKIVYYNGTGWITIGSGGTGGSSYGLAYNATTGQLDLVEGGSTSTATITLPVQGDVTGTSSATTVTALQGRNVSTNAPTDGQVLAWNNTSSQWEPTDVSAAGGDDWGTQVVQVDGTTITGDGSTTPLSVGTINVDDADADPANEIQNLSFDPGTNTLSLTEPGQPDQTADLSSLAAAGSGDMTKIEYDGNNNSEVDVAETISGSITTAQITDITNVGSGLIITGPERTQLTQTPPILLPIQQPLQPILMVIQQMKFRMQQVWQ